MYLLWPTRGRKAQRNRTQLTGGQFETCISYGLQEKGKLEVFTFRTLAFGVSRETEQAQRERAPAHAQIKNTYKEGQTLCVLCFAFYALRNFSFPKAYLNGPDMGLITSDGQLETLLRSARFEGTRSRRKQRRPRAMQPTAFTHRPLLKHFILLVALSC